jgi:hypothetical protein
VTASLAYRKNQSDILRGDVPGKYRDLIQYVPGDRVLEIGSAEGVLALLLAREGKDVTAMERQFSRHQEAIALRDEWLRAGILPEVARTGHVHGDIVQAIDLIEPDVFDTLVAIRMIYYLGEHLDPVFEQVARAIPNVVLCGNGNRAERWRNGIPADDTKADNFYASREGMTELLKRHGYRIVQEGSVNKGDEVVVGRKDG